MTPFGGTSRIPRHGKPNHYSRRERSSFRRWRWCEARGGHGSCGHAHLGIQRSTSAGNVRGSMYAKRDAPQAVTHLIRPDVLSHCFRCGGPIFNQSRNVATATELAHAKCPQPFTTRHDRNPLGLGAKP